ncbi:OPT/YSL family transporter [Ruminiclostridium sufflavum]|nr:OPT/YSL family transporter [Ruminiclostridium sufflavum]
MNDNSERNLFGIEQLSLRSLIFGALGSCVITASSMYVALRMSALPWPTIFVAVLSMALLKIFGKTTNNEINITQTAMSAGSMVAGGLAFTLPGLWIMGIWKGSADFSVNFFKVLAVAIAGMLFGTVASYILRYRFIVNNGGLTYPIGLAAAETIKAGDHGGKKSIFLFGSMIVSAVYTFFRDQLALVPQVFAYKSTVIAWNSPMAVGMGYILGGLYTGVWFLGALFSNAFIIPFGPKLGLFADGAEAAAFKTSAGIGLMVGTGLGVLIGIVVSAVKKLLSQKGSSDNRIKADKRKIFSFGRILIILTTALAFVFTIAAGISVIPSILLIIGIFIVSVMAASITGQTGINPMEIFGIIVLLGIRIFVDIDATDALLIAGCVAVSSGFSGDLFNDYKAGQVLGTNPKAQLISQIVGGVFGTVVASLALFAIINQFGEVGMDTALPAGQAVGVTTMINGIGDPVVFGVAAGTGAILYLLGLPTATLGIGIYLPFYISSSVFLGGLIRFITGLVKGKSKEDTGTVAASGLLGGEGITGVGIAIVKMFTGA